MAEPAILALSQVEKFSVQPFIQLTYMILIYLLFGEA